MATSDSVLFNDATAPSRDQYNDSNHPGAFAPPQQLSYPSRASAFDNGRARSSAEDSRHNVRGYRGPSGPSRCKAPRCSKMNIYDNVLSSNGKIIQMFSLYCQKHTCRAPRTQESGFCRELRRTSNRFCRSHGRCWAPGCAKVAPESEKTATIPYLCPGHKCLHCPRPQSGSLRVCEVHDRLGGGGSDNRSADPGESEVVEGFDPSLTKLIGPGGSESQAASSNLELHWMPERHPRGLQEPGTKETVPKLYAEAVPRPQSVPSRLSEKTMDHDGRDEVNLSVDRDTCHTTAALKMIQACRSNTAASSQWVSFSRYEVFYALFEEETSDTCEIYEPTLPQPTPVGLAPVSYFDILLGRSGRWSVPPFEDLELYRAIYCGEFDLVHQILEDHPGLADDTSQDLTPLQFAAGIAFHDIVPLLVIKGADTNLVSKSGKTALSFALDNGAYANAITLRAFGAGACDQQPKYSSQAFECPEIFKQLAKWTPETTLSPQNGVDREDLLQFIDRGQVDFAHLLRWGLDTRKLNVVEYVIQLHDVWPDADGVLETGGPEGFRALHYAAQEGYGKVVKRLIARGAQIDVTSNVDRLTPLMLAASHGQVAPIKALLERGANIFAKTSCGETAFKLAKDAGHHEALSILVEYNHRQMATMCDEDEEEMPHDAADNQDTGDIFGSSPVDVHHTLRESGGAESEAESLSQSPKSPEQGWHAADAEQNVSSGHLKTDGGFDGYNFSLPVTGSQSGPSDPFNGLLSTVNDSKNFSFMESDKRVKIAILDTGIDLTHRDWLLRRIVRFKEDGEHEREMREPRQWDRIMDFKNFCNPENTWAERDVTDLDGHGTQVAGIILRLAPRAEIYVARVYEGDRNKGISATHSKTPQTPRGIRPGAIAEAVDWAIAQGVHLINMSCGFLDPYHEVEDALERAKTARIVTFAAMCNDGNNRRGGAAWPARDPSLTIGIHSCENDYGTSPSDFTPPAVLNSDNFMTVGEGIMTHWPESKGGGFQIANGTSFATPVATAMAALILAFFLQSKCKKQREEAEADFGRDIPILRTAKLAAVLRRVSNKSREYRYLHPGLLWKDFNPKVKRVGDTPEERRKHAWEVIRDALC